MSKMEEKIREYMRVGLQPENWIQLAPDKPKVHPWVHFDGTVDASRMADDAIDEFTLPVTTIIFVLPIAKEVAQEYENTLHVTRESK